MLGGVRAWIQCEPGNDNWGDALTPDASIASNEPVSAVARSVLKMGVF